MEFEFNNEIRKLHFLTDEINFRILRILLEQSEGISIIDIANKIGITKAITKGRLQKFTEKHYCIVNLDITKFETRRLTKSYKLMYMLRPNLRLPFNNLVELIEKLCLQKIKMKIK